MFEVVQNNDDIDKVVAPISARTKDVLPRLAAKLNAPMISDVIQINGESEFVRNVYAGNGKATYEVTADKKLLSIRVSAFEEAALGAEESGEVEEMTLEADSNVVHAGR